MSSNHFTDTVSHLQNTPQSQRIGVLIGDIAKKMEASANPETRQLGTDLKTAQQQLVTACQEAA
jgi:hypothetical protein